ncbi:MAG: hypothetical protein LC791_11460 [Acidobacteria bacterium]|nr:hypothetical protein [Acidobacteriota bacterium]
MNTIVLKAAEPLGFLAESGGLLRLHVLYLSPLFQSLGISQWWAAVSLPPPSSLSFWLAFHYLTGFVMVFLYSALFERVLPGRGLIKGSLFSLLPWLVNGLVVLPLLGQGVLGYQRLAFSGMAYFFVANWSFGAVLGVLYEKFRSDARPNTAGPAVQPTGDNH